MDRIIEMVNNIISCVPLMIIGVILGMDSIRAVIASLGIFDPDKKLGRLIYGRRDRMIISSALRELGYSSQTSDDMVINMKKIPKGVYMANAGVKAEDASVQLIIMLSKYMLEFNDIILYGGESLTKSNYYIDTMEISHNKEDMQKLSAMMIYLLYSEGKRKKAPEVIITPKGGNPIFIQAVANALNSHIIVAKASSDKSKIKTSDELTYSHNEFLVNYEGSWFLEKENNKKSCVVMDCNASGGSQLLEIVKEIRKLSIARNSPVMLKVPSDVFILFRADVDGDNIDYKFNAYKCKIHRFFDLNEEAKSKMYKLKSSRQEKGRLPSYYCDEDVKEAQDIIKYLKDNGLYYYNLDRIKVECTDKDS